jgi:uncharacterized protein YjdB
MLKNKCISLAISSVLFLYGVFNSNVVFAQDNNIATERLSGSNRFETSIAISKAGWVQAPTVILASGLDFADALAASSLSKSKDAPILLTAKTSLEANTIAELKRLKTTKAFIIGGPGVISTSIEKKLTELGIGFTRIGGTDRYDTSKKVAEIIGVNNGIIMSSDSGFADSLSIATIASIKSIPILISPKNSLNPEIAAFIKGKNIPVSYIVGGNGVLGATIDSSLVNSKRLSGADRYLTNLSINSEFANDFNFDTVYLASGNDFPDALGGAALAAKNNAPIFLTDKNSISVENINFLKSKNVKHVVILGGLGVVSANVDNTVKAAINALVVHPEAVNLNKTQISLLVGKTEALNATVTPDTAVDKTINWKSSNNSVATVDNTGIVTAVSSGSAVITVSTTDGNKIKSCSVSVTNPVTAITLNKSSTELTISGTDILTEGRKDTLLATVIPASATNKDITWVSSNNEVVTVDNTGKISAVKAGTSIITVITSDGSKTATCTVVVRIAPVDKATGINFIKTEDNLIVGQADTLAAIVTPSTANEAKIWTSSDNSVVVVDSMGKITGINAGTAIIIATTADGAYVATCTITVKLKPPIVFAIDIGHNANYDTGAVGIRKEDVVNMEVGTRVISKLRALGYTVIDCAPTNATSTTDSLKQRTDIANAAHADYYMSIHFNIFNGTASGSEVFIGSNLIKDKAQQVLSNLVGLGYANRGVIDNSRGLYVLSNTDMPAMLVECAFLDSVSDMDRYDPDAIADALVNGLLIGN